jgi:ATP:ADP antiporter, AAA family
VIMRVAQGNGATVDLWVGRVFFVWTSVFNLFVISVFWCFMADVFRSDQAKRLFGFIGVGGTLGSIIGSGVTAMLAQRVGTTNLLLVSSVLLEIAIVIVMRFPTRPAIAALERSVPPAQGTASRDAIGGSIWAGITRLAGSPYLLGISLFLVLYTVGNTFLYFQQTDIIGRYYASRAARTEVLARIEFAVQTLTVTTQIFLTGRVIRWIGLAATLALLPALTMIGFAALGAVPVFATLVVFIVLRRGSNFALTNPAMEVLFTVVSREDKYKAKSFIETFVYRAGDQLSAWTYAGLAALGLGLAGTAFVAVPVAGVWLSVGVWLGRRQARLAGERTDVVAVPAAVAAI